jgi:hypothetical protein
MQPSSIASSSSSSLSPSPSRYNKQNIESKMYKSAPTTQADNTYFSTFPWKHHTACVLTCFWKTTGIISVRMKYATMFFHCVGELKSFVPDSVSADAQSIAEHVLSMLKRPPPSRTDANLKTIIHDERGKLMMTSQKRKKSQANQQNSQAIKLSVYKETGVMLCFAHFLLEPTPDFTESMFLEEIARHWAILSKNASRWHSAQKSLAQQRDEYLRDMETMRQQKEEIEKDTLDRCLHLLNTKKKKISELQEQIDALRAENEKLRCVDRGVFAGAAFAGAAGAGTVVAVELNSDLSSDVDISSGSEGEDNFDDGGDDDTKCAKPRYTQRSDTRPGAATQSQSSSQSSMPGLIPPSTSAKSTVHVHALPTSSLPAAPITSTRVRKRNKRCEKLLAPSNNLRPPTGPRKRRKAAPSTPTSVSTFGTRIRVAESSCNATTSVADGGGLYKDVEALLDEDLI